MSAETSGRGTLHLVVGPSGAGKDTLIDAARAARPDMLIPARVITRPADAGGERHIPATKADFAAQREAGAFALSWEAHGLSYGIPIDIEHALTAGQHVLTNVSRSVVGQARQRFAPLRIIVVTAPVKTLAARLAGRGRETAADIAARLARAPYAMPQGHDVYIVSNGGGIDAGVGTFLAKLKRA